MDNNKKRNLDEIADLRSGKKHLVDWLDKNKDWGYTLDELGITEDELRDKKYQHNINEDDTKQKFNKEEFRVINLYQYVSDFYGSSNIGTKSRDFCKRMVNITSSRLLSQNDIIAFNGENPGFGKGGSNSYSVFNYRGGSNCKHYWLKFKYDTDSGNLVEAPADEQQGWKKVD
jgi:hypothetical protein